MGYYIEKTNYYLPERIIDNEFLEKKGNIDREFLEKKVGIKSRHIADKNESVADMGVKASEKLFEEQGIDKTNIHFLLLCTQNPDYNLPTTACIIQDRLQLPKKCFAFDINLGCSGFIYSLIISGNFIQNGTFENALIIMADQYSKILDYNDKNTASLFGDAATASFISRCNDNKGVIDFEYGTDGSGYDKLILYNSGIVQSPEKSSYLYMNGREIFKFSMNVVPQSVNALLERNNLKISDINYFVFHQANAYMLNELRKRMQIEDEKMIIDMENYGNTVSATIPIAFKNLCDSGKLKKGDLIIFAGFGVGLSWGVVLYKY